MSINGDTWGVSSKQIKSGKPMIYRVSGCNDQHNLTINCPTEGNISLDIYGDYFFDYYPKPILHFGDNSTILNTIINTSHIKSILPEGTGDDINVRIEFLISSDEKELISYIQPNIGYVQGCEDSYPKTLNCPNNNKFKITEIIKKMVSSRVYFSNLEDWEIKSYVDTNEPLYCAGGFALEGIGGKYIEKIEGCFSNVMGLSLPWLRENLYR